MATAIPKRKDKSPEGLGLPPSLGLTLSYEDKVPVENVLATPPAAIKETLSIKSEDDTSAHNELYFAENLAALSLLRTRDDVRGQVRLIYIDPPYATGGVFESRTERAAYNDQLVGSHYVEFLRQRLILLRELLADDGSIYVHLDKNMAFAAKMILDEVFGARNFRSWITRKKCNPKNYTSKTYGNVADFILFYSKSDKYVWNRPVEEWTDARAAKEYIYVDDAGRRYKKVPVHAPGRRNGETGKVWRGMMPPPGKHWQYTPARLDEMDKKGEIYWSPTGNPRRKVYLENSAGIPVQDIWMEFRDAHNQNIKVTGFPTEKNPDMLKRIVGASSDPGDLVLDCFCGSGSTLQAASDLKRRWIGIDNSGVAIQTTLERFALGLKRMGDFVSLRQKPVEKRSVQDELFNASSTSPLNIDVFSSEAPLDTLVPSEAPLVSVLATKAEVETVAT